LNVIRMENVHKRFGDVLALNGLSVQVAEGETLGLLGPNGSGKTTTVRLLNGVIFPDEGDIGVFGYSPKTGGQEIRSRTGVVTENAALYENLTAHENLAFFGRLFGLSSAAAAKKADALLELFSLKEKRDEKAGNLSTGMKKKLVIARALVGDPKILFLDEPTSGLDPEAARGIVTLINELKQSRVTVFACTHNLNEAEHYCDRYVFLDKGKSLEQGTYSELEKKYLKSAVIELEASGEVPRDFGYPYEREADKLVVRLNDVKEIPGAVRSLSAGMDVYGVKRQNASLESLYFEIRGEKA
jgi:ABC-2 type transport system ATP-binding protein